MCDGGGAQHPLPLPADAHHGALDQEGLHPHPAQAAGDEAAPAQESHVSNKIKENKKEGETVPNMKKITYVYAWNQFLPTCPAIN